MFFEYMKLTGGAVVQSFVLAAIGYFLTKKNFLRKEGLDALSRLVIDVTLPVLIFSQLIKDFNFSLYPDWWVFPLLSLGITLLGLCVGGLFLWVIKGKERKAQFLGLVAFQNSGYLPLVLVTGLLPQEKLGTMFIYIFLFLLGFNFIVFSIGVYIVAAQQKNKMQLVSFLSPPVIATCISLLVVFMGLDVLLPEVILAPLKMFGDCTLPLAMLVLGGGLAEIRLSRIEKPVVLALFAKLLFLPLIGLLLLSHFRVPELWGLLIIMQLAMPPAAMLSVIVRHYQKEDLLISSGILYGHLAALLTVPLFLSLYFMLNMVK